MGKQAIHLYDVADNWVGTVTAPGSRITRPIDEDGGYRYTTRLTLPRGLTRKQRRQAVQAAQTTMRWGCHCEHDCCGHSFGWSVVRVADARTLVATTFVVRNI